MNIMQVENTVGKFLTDYAGQGFTCYTLGCNYSLANLDSEKPEEPFFSVDFTFDFEKDKITYIGIKTHAISSSDALDYEKNNKELYDSLNNFFKKEFNFDRLDHKIIISDDLIYFEKREDVEIHYISSLVK